MTIQRMIELLEIEHECILRNSHDDCDRNCSDCDLVQDDDELHEMYTDVISLLKEQKAVIRCKDCKHQKEYRTGSCPFYTMWGSVAPNDWFCADWDCKEGR